jgi:hypothetical protein
MFDFVTLNNHVANLKRQIDSLVQSNREKALPNPPTTQPNSTTTQAPTTLNLG